MRSTARFTRPPRSASCCEAPLALGSSSICAELLVARLVGAELVLELVARLLELPLLAISAGQPSCARTSRLHLLDDHRRAPRRLLLRAEDVAVDVVADVEDPVARDAERALEVVQVAALVDRARARAGTSAGRVRPSPTRCISGRCSWKNAGFGTRR